jgi:hypothetical protein
LITDIISLITTNKDTNIVSVVCSVPNGKCHNFLIIKLNHSIGIVDHKHDSRYMKTMENNQKNNYSFNEKYRHLHILDDDAYHIDSP